MSDSDACFERRDFLAAGSIAALHPNPDAHEFVTAGVRHSRLRLRNLVFQNPIVYVVDAKGKRGAMVALLIGLRAEPLGTKLVSSFGNSEGTRREPTASRIQATAKRSPNAVAADKTPGLVDLRKRLSLGSD